MIPLFIYNSLGELLYLTGRVYHHNVSSADRKLAALTNVVDAREASEMMYFLAAKIVYTFGIPRSMTPFGITADMDRNVHLVMPRDGDAAKIKSFMQLEGSASSYYEHATTEALYQTQALSAVKALQLARDQGVPVHTVTPENADLILPALQVSGDVRTDIQTALHQGWQAIVPQQNLTLQDWSGVGYILQNPENGEGYYRIAGGYGGAVTLRGQDISDRIDNIPAGEHAISASNAAERRSICRLYAGPDGIAGTGDDKCYTPYTKEEATKRDRQCDARYSGRSEMCATRYDADPANAEITERFLIEVNEHGPTQMLTTYIQAQHWRSQDEAPYMRAGYTVLTAVKKIMQYAPATSHGLDGAGSGFRTHTRQQELYASGNKRACRERPDGSVNCLIGHHLDGTAADILLSNSGAAIPKTKVLCLAKRLIGFGETLSSEVLHEGTEGTVHIAKPAKRQWSDEGIFNWSCWP